MGGHARLVWKLLQITTNEFKLSLHINEYVIINGMNMNDK
jgi:hypothetical protein